MEHDNSQYINGGYGYRLAGGSCFDSGADRGADHPGEGEKKGENPQQGKAEQPHPQAKPPQAQPHPEQKAPRPQK